jgi:hypothetical protein
MNISEQILSSVKSFRLSVGLGKQENAVHQQLYASESVELLVATTHAEKADALADMAVVMAGHYLNGNPFYDFEAAIAGLIYQSELNKVNLLEAFKIVMVSNMSKVCQLKDIHATDQKYDLLGMDLVWERRESLWSCYAYDNYPDAPKGKLLKPVTYSAPDWSGEDWKL